MWEKIKENWITNLIMLVLIVAVSFLTWRSFNSKKEVQEVLKTSNNTNYITLQGNPKDYFIPTAKKPETAISAKMNRSQNTTNQETQSNTNNQENELSKMTLADQLYQFIANGKANISAGIRSVPDNTTGFIPKVHAATNKKYPAVYFWLQHGYSSPDYISEAREVNIFTGEQTSVFTQKDKVFAGPLSFNQKKQVIAYASEDPGLTVTTKDVKIFYLNTKEDVMVAKGIGASGGQIAWSPDGELLAFPDIRYDTTGKTISYVAHIYNMSTKATKDINLLDSNHPMLDPTMSNWSDDGKYLVAYERGGTLVDDYYNEKPCTISVADGTISCLSEKMNTKNINRNIMLVNNKIISLTNDNPIPYDNSKAPIANSTYGWLSVYDINSKTSKEYRSETGDYLQQWIVNKDADQIVFLKATGKDSEETYELKLEHLNLKDGAVTDLPMPEKPKGYEHSMGYTIVGWNGNEENILLWDSWSVFWNVNIKSGKITQITK